MKIKTANVIMIIFSISLAIGLLGCKPKKKEENNTSQAEATQKDKQKAESDEIADTTKDMPASTPDESDEASKETIISAEQTIDTMPNELTESENSSSEFINETHSTARVHLLFIFLMAMS